MGKFITFEGGEGSGKSSVIEYAAAYLANRGYAVATAKDPGGTPLGEEIRGILLTAKNKKMAHETELLLYLASRAELVHNRILPALKTHDFVLCDRFFDSTTVYQGMLRGWNNINPMGFASNYRETFLEALHRIFSANLIPDLTLLLDVDAVDGLSRSLGDSKDEGKWEAEGLRVHRLINATFRQLAAENNNRFIALDSNQNLGMLVADMRIALDYQLNEWAKGVQIDTYA